MRILILGRRSRLGSYLKDAAESLDDEVVVPNLDVTSTANLFGQSYQPDVVINCAAVSDVNHCERNASTAYRVNAYGAAHAALFARTLGAYFIHISTDYVFSGNEGPYMWSQRPYPIQYYGHTKYVGEIAVRSMMQNNPYTIVRLGWLYGSRYAECAPMLAIKGGQKYMWDTLKGVPTHAGEAADVLIRMLHANDSIPGMLPPITHISPSMNPVSWYDFIRKEIDFVEPIPNPEGFPFRPSVGGLVPNVFLTSEMSHDLRPLWRELESESRPKKRLWSV